jgi:hypothetical protein
MAAVVIPGVCTGCAAACGTAENNPNPGHTSCPLCGYQIFWSIEICDQCGQFVTMCYCFDNLEIEEEHKEEEQKEDSTVLG